MKEVLVEHAKWYTKRFVTIQPDWYVFPGRVGRPELGRKRPLDPTRPMVTLKTSWNNAKARANVKGRWHDNRHTFVTGLAESGQAGDEAIRDLAGHVPANAKTLIARALPARSAPARAPS